MYQDLISNIWENEEEGKMKKFTKLLLVGVMVFALVACGGGGAGGDADVDTNSGDGGGTSAVIYTAEEIQMTMAELLGIDASEINVEDRDTGAYVGYGDWDIWFDAYILNDPEFTLEMFEIGVWDDVDYEKLIDTKDHKIWIEHADTDTDSVLAMKGNLAITVSSPLAPEVVIEALDLE